MDNLDPIVVVGGGIGGLSAAIRLASMGRKVVLLEKNPTVGGKMAEYHQDGYRWDIGPSVLTMKDVFEDLFKFAGKRMDDAFQVFPMDPLTSYFYADGKRLDIRRDLSRTLQEIEAINPQGVEDYLSFLAYAAKQFRITRPIYTYGPPPTFSSIRKIGMQNLMKVDAFKDYFSAISAITKLGFLQQLFARYAIYFGSNPFTAPAVLSVIAHIELSKGIWYPRGGIFTLAKALERLAIEKGVKIYTNRGVSQIVVQEREVRGVLLEDGTSFEANTVISDVDYATTYSTLLPQKPPYRWELENYQKQPASTSAFILLLGIKGRFSLLSHHNVLFSKDYRNEYSQIFKSGIPAEDPTVYIAVSSKTDSNHAPSSCENWYVMVNVPSLNGKFDWKNQADQYRGVVLNKIKKMGFDIEGKIMVEKAITPIDLEAMSGANKGSIYGLEYLNWQTALKRPKPDPKNPNGLYLVGGTSHPGGGVPLVALSAKYVSELIMGK